MRILRTIVEMRAALYEPRRRGERVGLVPTMGSFHAGHLSLVQTALAECDLVVASLFVNPLQFGPGEDLGAYPRDEAADAQTAAEAGVNLLFAPAAEEMYPLGFGTTVDAGPVARSLEGELRPGHFRGVATVVTRLLGIVAPDVAYFGQKDCQQVAVIRRVVADLALPTELRTVPTSRDADGLALSSRNRYLATDQRALAILLYRGLVAADEAYGRGERDERALREIVLERLDQAGIDVGYVELRETETFSTYDPSRPAVLLAAIRVGGTHLIDNLVLTGTGISAASPAEAFSEGSSR